MACRTSGSGRISFWTGIMEQELKRIKANALEALGSLSDGKALAEIRTRVLGRKGELTQVLRGLRDLAPEVRSEAGRLANVVKAELTEAFDRTEELLRERVELAL